MGLGEVPPGNCLPGRKSCWLRAAFFSGLQEDTAVSTTAETGIGAKACDNAPQCSMHCTPSLPSKLHPSIAKLTHSHPGCCCPRIFLHP